MLETVAAILAFGLIVMAGRQFNAGADFATGFFPAQGQSDWPHGIQEEDVPRFVFAPTA